MAVDALQTLVVADALRDRQTAAGFVADSLREAIQSGTLADGAQLNQVALAGHFGVSRVPVREALRVLEAEGWITALPHRRAVVLAQSPERVREIFDVRALLEAHLLAKAIDAVDAPGIAHLRMLCDAMEPPADHHARVAANRAFHATLLAAAGSPMTLELLEQLSSQVERYVRHRGGAAEHRAIVAAVEARDVITASALMAACHAGGA